LASWLTSGSINSQELVPGQIYNTGNIVQQTTTSSGSTWVNGVYQSSLTCWQWGDPGYCGPNAIIRPGNNINFSYGSTYIYQQQNVSTILPSSTGLQVNGYNFSFTAKNGNGWDNGMTDQLTALVRFWDTTGGRGTSNLLYGNSYNLSYKYDWTTFNYSETFTSPLSATSIGQVQYGFIGKDNNGWAGPYGPELQGVNFSLKYSVDPCIKDPLYSPTCSGFLDALNKLSGPATSSTSSTSSPIAITQTVTESQPVTQTTTVSGPPPSAVSADILSKVLESNKTTETASAASITAGTNLNDKSSLASYALSVIAKNAANEKALQDKSVSESLSLANAAANTAVEQSQAIALSQSQASSAINSERLPGASNANSAPSPGVNTTASSPQAGSNSAMQPVVSVLLPPNTQTTTTDTQQTNTPVIQPAPAVNTNVGSNVVTPTVSSYELLPPAPIAQNENPAQGLNIAINSTPLTTSIFVSPSPMTEAPKLNESDSNRNIDMSSPTDFIAGYVNTKHNLNEMQSSVNTSTVNSKVQDNDAAGSVSIASIAKMPPGYDLYTSMTLKDVNFYKPEELYRGQKTVDNVRLLRGLTGASDRVHQEMVDEQYKNK
jgi:hypothetical protein